MPTDKELREAYSKNSIVYIETMYNSFYGHIKRYDHNIIDLFIDNTNQDIMIPVDMIETFKVA